MSAARDHAEAAFHSAFGRVPDVIARAPGRVNLIGEHVDYNDGIVLPFAIERDVVVCVSQARSAGRWIRAADHPAAPDAYVHSVAAELAAAGINSPDFELSVAGDVPIGAGLSSSAALTCATALALLGLADATLPSLEIAQLCRRAEHRAVGVRCGIMDPYTSLFARAGHALLLDTRTLEHEQVSVPDGAAFVIVDSGVNRALAGSAYNQRVAECRAAARLLGVASLRDVSLEQVEAAAGHLGAVLCRRAHHVVSEIDRTRQAARALESADLERLGALMLESHASLRRDYEVAVPELNTLVDAAMRVPGVWGSRLTGAGFGGCTITVLSPAGLAAFEQQVPEAYRRATGGECRVLRTRPASGAGLL